MQNSDNTKRVNRLSKEKSPYLKQHQYNPVDWYPWGEEAFTKAQREDKPVFLSVGYSTCQWCHIMEREAFSDPEIAQLMNEVFVSIKVDREERPDIDNIYMAACQVISAGGGWPLSVILTPEGRPFFAGTYFGKESQRDNPGLKDIIIRTQDIWSKFRNEIIAQADENTDQLNIIAYKAGDKGISKVAARKAFYELASHYDEANGGFGNKQKFPIPHYFMYLLRYGLNNDVPEAIDMTTKTLRSMRYGGIWDHVGYGFHRYSTDPEWKVPHFEKMLYDQALLSIAYMEAYQVTGDNLFKKTAQQLLDYMTNNLLTEEGGFYSAEDTDFDIIEDRFYTWQIEEIRELLIGNVDFFSDVFNIKEKGNYFDEFAGKMNGNNILYRLKSDKQIAQKFDLEIDEVENKIDSLLNILQERRKSRKPLHKDTKILTDWNGLAITAFSKAATVFGEEKYAKIANNTINFITSKLMKPNLTFYHRYSEGESGIEGMIDDYVFTALGLLEFYKYSNEKEYLQLAENIITKFIELFEDTKDGGYFFTSSKAEILISRRKEIHDSSTPSGNSVLLDVFLRLYSFTRKEYYREQAEKLINTFASAINNVPSAYTYFLSGLDKFNNDNVDLVFTGNGNIDDIIRGINSKFNPYINIHNLTNRDFKSELPDFIDNISQDSDEITCYVCIGSKCDDTILGKDTIISVLQDKYSVKL